MCLFKNVLGVEHDVIDARHLLKYHQHDADDQWFVHTGVLQIWQVEAGSLQVNSETISSPQNKSGLYFSCCELTCSSHASSMRAHSHSMGASGPRRNRSASSASRLFPLDSRKRGVSGMKHIRTMSSVGGMEQQMASQRQFMKRPAGRVHTNHNPSHIPSLVLRPFFMLLASQKRSVELKKKKKKMQATWKWLAGWKWRVARHRVIHLKTSWSLGKFGFTHSFIPSSGAAAKNTLFCQFDCSTQFLTKSHYW